MIRSFGKLSGNSDQNGMTILCVLVMSSLYVIQCESSDEPKYTVIVLSLVIYAFQGRVN